MIERRGPTAPAERPADPRMAALLGAYCVLERFADCAKVESEHMPNTPATTALEVCLGLLSLRERLARQMLALRAKSPSPTAREPDDLSGESLMR